MLPSYQNSGIFLINMRWLSLVFRVWSLWAVLNLWCPCFQQWFRIDVRPFKTSLLLNIKRWGFAFKQHLMDHVVQSLAGLKLFHAKKFRHLEIVKINGTKRFFCKRLCTIFLYNGSELVFAHSKHPYCWTSSAGALLSSST